MINGIMMTIPFIEGMVDDYAHRFLSENEAAGHYKLAGFLYCSALKKTSRASGGPGRICA
jgi:hypothetical protein